MMIIDIHLLGRIKGMKKQAITMLLVFSTILLFGQSPKETGSNNIGVNYFGELGFRPGLEIDYGLNLLNKNEEQQKRLFTNQLTVRPSFAYYHYSNYSNNILLSLKLNYQLKFNKQKSNRYIFVEPFGRIGLLRYFLSGDVFETQDNEFTKVKFRGSNSFVFGGGLDLGGYLSKRFDWLLGFDYYAEKTEDKLTLHRFVLKLGTRIKIN